MRVWIVNYYTSPDNPNPRYIEFARRFTEKGWDVVTFYADWRATDSEPLFKKQQVKGLDFVKVKAPHYIGNGFARMKSIFCFAWMIKKHCKEFDKPDVILHNVHAPFDAPIVLAAKRLECKYISEVWDLWPDAFVHLGLISSKHPIMKLFYWIEKLIYYNSNQLIFTFLGGIDYLKEKKWTKESGGKIDVNLVHYVSNGVDLNQFDKDREAWPREDADLKNSETLKVVYLGSINRANHVHTLIEAAKLLQDQLKYRFFIYGDGTDREELEKKVKDDGITNVIFKEKRIPLCECAWVVSQATINIMNYQKGFAYKGISSGKLFQYLAAGKPIVCNINIAYDDVITENNLGVARDIETPEEFAKAIRSVAEQSQENYHAMCERVRKVAERFDYNKLAAEELSIIEAAMVSK